VTEFFQFALLGLAAGAIYALLAQGIVLIYRGSGVVNVAHGAYAMFAAYIYNDLHGHGLPLWIALSLSLALIMLLGAANDQLILRRLRSASSLARMISTLGVLLLLQSVAIVIWGANQAVVPPFIPSHPIKIFGAVTTSDRMWLLVIVIVLTAVLLAVWHFTSIGWIVEAVSQNPRFAAALGRSPEPVSTGTWVVGAGLAGLAGILIAPISQLNQTNLTLTVIVALTAALVGGFDSFVLTLVAALVLGVAQAEVNNYVQITGAEDTIPFLVIVVVLMIRGSALPIRGYLFDRFPRTGTGRISARLIVPAVLFVSVLIIISRSSLNWLTAITSTMAIALILLSLVVLMGYAGQVSLSQYSFAGAGALIAGQVMIRLHFPFVPAFAVGAVGAGLVAGAFAIPALRTRGVNLALVTLGLSLALQSIVFNDPTISGGFNGINLPTLTLFGWNIDPLAHQTRYAFFTLFVFALACMAVANLRRGASGRQMLAIRSNERAAASLGLNVTVVKLYSFVTAGVLAGAGGVLFAFQYVTLLFANYDPITSITATAESFIGGVGYVLGTVSGATLSPSSIGSVVAVHWQSIDNWLPIVGAVSVIITLLQHPAGLADTIARNWHRRVGSPRPQGASAMSWLGPDHRVRQRTLKVDGMTVRYGAVTAVDGVSLVVQPGEVVGLIGPNGAGKTSLMDALTGFATAVGRVRLDDVEVQDWASHRRASAGLVRSFQGLELFGELTVLDNILVTNQRVDLKRFLRDLVWPVKPQLSAAASAAIEEFDLLDDLDKLPDSLPYGRRRLVAIARAVALEPSILLLDEPAAGLDEHESAELAVLVRRLATTWGMGVLVIEHDMQFVMGVSDRIIVLDFGRQIADGTPAEIANDSRVLAAYLGEPIAVGKSDGAAEYEYATPDKGESAS